MPKNRLTDKKIENLVGEIARTYKGDSGINFIDASDLPVRSEILQILDLLFEVLFPGYTGRRKVTKSNINFIVGDILRQVYTDLAGQIERIGIAVEWKNVTAADAKQWLRALPGIYWRNCRKLDSY